MLKRSFWMAAIVAPLCFSPACELVSDAVRQGALKGGYGQGSGGSDGNDGMEPAQKCKPLDEERAAAAKCMDPRWEDRDGDGCIDSYACADYTGDKDPTECKPFPKELLDGCSKPLIEDRDNDGCIDYFACLDQQGEPVGGPDDKEPTMCKPLPPSDGCAKPYFEDRDGDGCIDYYVCTDYVAGKPELPLPPKK